MPSPFPVSYPALTRLCRVQRQRAESSPVSPSPSPSPSPLALDFPCGGSGGTMKLSPRAAERRQADFEALYERHSREVWALAYARWLNADLAMDIMQEAFMRLWKQWQAREEILNPRAWLLRVARNLAEDHAKSAFRRNGTHPPATMNGVKAHDVQPLDRLEKEETFGQLRQMLNE